MRSIDIDFRMLFIVVLVPILLQGTKHGLVLHVVTINNGVEIAKIWGIPKVHKDTSSSIVAAIQHPAKVVVIVICLDYGIVDYSALTINPAYYVRIFG